MESAMSNEFTPPSLADLLLRRILPPVDAEVIAGDLLELARTRIEPRSGRTAARRWYWRQVGSIAWARLTSRAPEPRDIDQSDIRKGTTVAAFRQDVWHAMRALRKQPAFTAMAVVMLALGIGATVAIFSLVNAVILKPLPFAEPDRLMLVHLVAPGRDDGAASGPRPMIWSWPKYRVFRDNQRAFESSATYSLWNWNLTGAGDPARIDGELVEASYFDVLGLHAAAGRTFARDEARSAGSAPLVVLAHRTWQERFASASDVIGRSIGLNGIPHTVIGVMPAGFRGLTGQADMWVPVTTLAAADLEEKWNHSYYVVARRHIHVTAAQAAADARTVGAIVHAEIGDPGRPGNAPWGATAVPLDDERVDPLIRRSVLLLLGAVTAVLLIVCINLANLTLVRGLARQRDVAIRLALGASRARIISLFMTESALLAALGAVAALGVASLLLSAGAALMPDLRAVLPRSGAASGLTRVGLGTIGLDAATVIFAMIAAAVAALMFGLVPAWRASRRDLTGTIKAGASGALAEGSRGLSGRNLLIVAETALALVLLSAGGLMLKSVARLQATELGFEPASLLSVRIALPAAQYSGARATHFFEQLVTRLGARGELDAVAYASCAPVQMGCNATTASFPDRPPAPPGTKPMVGVMWASPTYFETIGARLLRGRVFTAHDRIGQPNVVIVNETAARQFWPNQDPVGKRLGLGQGGFEAGAEVVGVVADVHYASPDRAVTPDAYIPLLQSRRAQGVIFVRSRVDARAAVSIVRSEVQGLDPDVPLTDIRMMQERVNEATWRTRMSAWLLGAFAGLALLLVALGVYGVVSQGVQQRTREIGVRLAMGAAHRDIVRLIIGRVLAVSVAGIVSGLLIAVPAMKLLAALLYQVQPADPWVLTPIALVLLVIGLIAGYVPARRATRLDPLTTLRTE
jgi:putative ABC transport system permease protein